MIQFLRDYFAYRKSINELHNLSSRELEDIGLTRHSIKTVLKPRKPKLFRKKDSIS